MTTETEKFEDALEEAHRLFDFVMFLDYQGVKFPADVDELILRFLEVDPDKLAVEGNEGLRPRLTLIRGGA